MIDIKQYQKTSQSVTLQCRLSVLGAWPGFPSFLSILPHTGIVCTWHVIHQHTRLFSQIQNISTLALTLFESVGR